MHQETSADERGAAWRAILVFFSLTIALSAIFEALLQH
jgi:hypothetical protein